MAILSVPDTPREILAGEMTTQEGQVMVEGNQTFFIDHFEYPEKGGVLVYKYGGTLPPLNIDFSKFEEPGNKCLAELRELLQKYDFDLVGNDGGPVQLMPNEVIRAENDREVQNRVDLLYPEKSVPDALAVSLANQVKRVLKEAVMFFSYKWTILAFWPIIFFPFKYKVKVLERWLDGWSGYGVLTMNPRIMQRRYYTEFCRELLKFIYNFLKHIGVSDVVADRTAWIVAEIIERDNAYRWRIQDLLNETAKHRMLAEPVGEIKWLNYIFHKREKKSMKLAKTIDSTVKLMTLVLKLPRIKRAFKYALEQSTFENFQFDEIDKHAVMRYVGYEFFGLPYETRIMAWERMYNGNPPKSVYVKA